MFQSLQSLRRQYCIVPLLLQNFELFQIQTRASSTQKLQLASTQDQIEIEAKTNTSVFVPTKDSLISLLHTQLQKCFTQLHNAWGRLSQFHISFHLSRSPQLFIRKFPVLCTLFSHHEIKISFLSWLEEIAGPKKKRYNRMRNDHDVMP